MATYRDSGVNIEEGYKSVNLMKEHVQKTFNKGVLNDIGSFAAMYELGQYKNPVLVSGTDGVGTKLKIAFELEKYDSIGIDCVAMCVNDILCHGAKPIFFLDYMACGQLKGEVAANIVKGVSDGCLMAGCSLIGGETAEMPGFYKNGEYDIAGFAVGVVEKEDIINGQDIKEGDVLIGIASSGVHSNGYSLVRSVIKDFKEEFNGKIIGEELLTPTKIYVKSVLELLKSYPVKGMAHITGGGFYENIPRMFKGDLNAIINKNSFPRPDIFKYIISKGVDEDHMFNVFNMGIGFILCVDPSYEKKIIEKLVEQGERAYKIGYVEKGERKVIIK